MSKIYSNLLKKGDTIGVAALTWKPDEQKVYEGEAILNSLGFEVDVHENCYLEDGQMAGTERQRLQAFNELLADDIINGIIFARGGYGTPQLLADVDYDLVAKNLKHIQGYSDTTALLNAIYAQTGLVTYHGPMVGTANTQLADSQTQESFMNVAVEGFKEISLKESDLVTAGVAEGTLIGGNMTLMDHLIGTPYFPADEKVILLLEDVGEKINELDKFFYHLQHAGIKSRVQGIIFGEESTWEDNTNAFGYTLKQVLQKHFENIPCIMNAPVGHGKTIITLPIGAAVKLEVNDLKRQLSILR